MGYRSTRRRARRSADLGPERPVTRTFWEHGIQMEELKCGHTMVAKPIVGVLRGRAWRRCQDCAVLMRLSPDDVQAPTPRKAGRGQRSRWAKESRYRNLIRRAFAQLCAYCGVSDGNTMDHVLAQSKGGPRGTGNMIASCVKCNSGKGDLTLEQFFALRKDLSRESFERRCKEAKGRLQKILDGLPPNAAARYRFKDWDPLHVAQGESPTHSLVETSPT